MKAYRLKRQLTAGALVLEPGSIVIIDDTHASIRIVEAYCEEVADGTPISVPASRIEPVDPGIGG